MSPQSVLVRRRAGSVSRINLEEKECRLTQRGKVPNGHSAPTPFSMQPSSRAHPLLSKHNWRRGTIVIRTRGAARLRCEAERARVRSAPFLVPARHARRKRGRHPLLHDVVGAVGPATWALAGDLPDKRPVARRAEDSDVLLGRRSGQRLGFPLVKPLDIARECTASTFFTATPLASHERSRTGCNSPRIPVS